MFISELLNDRKYKYFAIRFGRLCFIVSNYNCHITRERNAVDAANISVYIGVLIVETFNQKGVNYRVVGSGNSAL